MESLEQLKKEQYDAKAKLHELVELINSEEFFSLSPKEKGLVSQQRTGIEMYLNALTNRIYNKNEFSFDASAMWPLLMSSMFTSSFGSSSSLDSLKKKLDESDFEKKDDGASDEQVYAVPV